MASKRKNGSNNTPAAKVRADGRSVKQVPETNAGQNGDIDRALVERCVSGLATAWEELYDRGYQPLIQQISFGLGARSRDRDLVEEIAAKVWFALVRDDCRVLKRFRPNGAKLETFLATIARYEVLRYLRAEHRRIRREREARISRRHPQADQAEQDLTLDMQQFSQSLTPREREFLQGNLLCQIGSEALKVSASNTWQLRHRIRKKLNDYLA